MLTLRQRVALIQSIIKQVNAEKIYLNTICIKDRTARWPCKTLLHEAGITGIKNSMT